MCSADTQLAEALLQKGIKRHTDCGFCHTQSFCVKSEHAVGRIYAEEREISKEFTNQAAQLAVLLFVMWN